MEAGIGTQAYEHQTATSTLSRPVASHCLLSISLRKALFSYSTYIIIAFHPDYRHSRLRSEGGHRAALRQLLHSGTGAELNEDKSRKNDLCYCCFKWPDWTFIKMIGDVFMSLKSLWEESVKYICQIVLQYLCLEAWNTTTLSGDRSLYNATLGSYSQLLGRCSNSHLYLIALMLSANRQEFPGL